MPAQHLKGTNVDPRRAYFATNYPANSTTYQGSVAGVPGRLLTHWVLLWYSYLSRYSLVSYSGKLSSWKLKPELF